MDKWSLPYTLNVHGIDLDIRTDFRTIIKICKYISDPDLYDWTADLILKGLYKNPEKIPKGYELEALEKASWFIACGNEKDGKEHNVKLMDWEQDSDMIIPAVNRVAGYEIRAVKELHWWTFLGYYMEIGESSFTTVLGIRSKLAKGKKLEKWEKEYLRDNAEIVNLKAKMTTEQYEQANEEKEALRKLLGY